MGEDSKQKEIDDSKENEKDISRTEHEMGCLNQALSIDFSSIEILPPQWHQNKDLLILNFNTPREKMESNENLEVEQLGVMGHSQSFYELSWETENVLYDMVKSINDYSQQIHSNQELAKSDNKIEFEAELVEETVVEDDAKLLLHRVVECFPLQVDLWISLARLEKYYAAKKVLNKAREKLPKEQIIRITSAKLEEAFGSTYNVGKIIESVIQPLQRKGVEIDREARMTEAETTAETTEWVGYVAKCNATISNIIRIWVEEEDRNATKVADVEEYKKKGSIGTSRAIYSRAITAFRLKKSVWLNIAQLEKAYCTWESLDALIRKAITYTPQVEVLWMMGAKEKWIAWDVPAKIHIL
ncbi:hypothetical protein L1987_83453 [Smallanthus sonchifolius]|uniref:Uncharacterized protein n=1 Tax=Smallanthus sonchifolius TaxID=185202 RepID=A0ACB8YD96_9ASTR|nr:hypothetical protein L1987_83453 [Smallanthus sonchifolius]